MKKRERIQWSSPIAQYIAALTVSFYFRGYSFRDALAKAEAKVLG